MHFQKYTIKSTIRNFNNAIQNSTRKARLATSRVRQNNNNNNHLGQLFTCSLKWASTSFQVPLLSSRAFHSPKTGFCPIHSSQTRKLSLQFAKNSVKSHSRRALLSFGVWQAGIQVLDTFRSDSIWRPGGSQHRITE